MILSMLTLAVRAGHLPELAESFRRHQVLQTAIEVEGCRTLALATPGSLSTGDTAYVVGLWDDQDAYQRWLDHPHRGDSFSDLLALAPVELSTIPPAALWHVLDTATDGGWAPAMDPGRATASPPPPRKDQS